MQLATWVCMHVCMYVYMQSFRHIFYRAFFDLLESRTHTYIDIPSWSTGPGRKSAVGYIYVYIYIYRVYMYIARERMFSQKCQRIYHMHYWLGAPRRS